MTHDEFVVRSCRDKVPYVGRREARDHAQKTMHARGGGRLTAYRCHVNDEHWHVGHPQSGPARRRMA